MTDSQLLTTSFSLIGALFTVLVLLVGWFGSHMMTKLDALNAAINTLAGDLHNRINSQDTRLTRTETHVERINDVLFQRGKSGDNGV